MLLCLCLVILQNRTGQNPMGRKPLLRHQLIRVGNDPDVGFSPLNNRFNFNYVDTFKKQT